MHCSKMNPEKHATGFQDRTHGCPFPLTAGENLVTVKAVFLVSLDILPFSLLRKTVFNDVHTETLFLYITVGYLCYFKPCPFFFNSKKMPLNCFYRKRHL